MVMTTSASATASAAVSNTEAPLAAAAAAAVGTGSNPRTIWPAPIKFADIGAPMLPNPRNAMVVIVTFLSGGAEPCGFGPTDDHSHDFVGPFQDSMHPQIADDLLEAILAQIAIATVQLQRLVGDVVARVGDIALGHRAQLDLVSGVVVECIGGAPQRHSRGLEPGGHVGQGEPDGGFVEQGSAERLSLAHIGARFVEGGLRAAQRARRDVEPAAVEAVHRDAKTGAFAVGAAQHRIRGYPYPLQHHLRGGLCMPAHLFFQRAETKPRSALFDDKGGDATRALAAGASHHHVHIRYSRTGNELLDAVEH